MLTAMRAVENLCDGAGHDIWAVNAESVYHEEDHGDEEKNPYPYKDAPPENEAREGRGRVAGS